MALSDAQWLADVPCYNFDASYILQFLSERVYIEPKGLKTLDVVLVVLFPNVVKSIISY